MFQGAFHALKRAVTGQTRPLFRTFYSPLILTCSKRNLSRMRLVQFEEGGHVRLGVELSNGGDVVDVTAADKSIPTDMRSFLEGGDSVLQAAKRVVSSGGNVIKKGSLKLKAPITNPEKVLCVGMNYKDHCLEQNAPIPEEPVFFNKFASSIVGPTDNIVYPGDLTSELDWEVELTIVIGKTGKNIKEADAMQYVAGYTVAHDVSARDWQMKKNLKQWMLGKCMDTFCPLGPAIVTTDALSDPHNLGIRCRVNGKTVQDSNTDQLVFKTQSLLAFISRFVTLKPGDIILTGTPPGVGVFLKPQPVFLKRGDVVDVEIDEIGTYPHNLGIRCRVNGKTVQDSNTDHLVFKTQSLLAFISRFVTLKPGDIILTGTPSGVGVFLKPQPVFLKRGDVVDVEIDEIGTCTNQVV